VIATVQLATPTIDEVPSTLPVTLLWNFCGASIATQLILGLVIELTFGYLAERPLLQANG
jgi:hypothetical protein